MALALSATRAAVLGGAAPWTPAKLPGLAMWLAAHRLGLADGAAVANLTDQSPNGNTPTQGTAGNKAVIAASAQGNRDGVRFDADDFYLAADSASLDITNNVGVFAAVKLPASLALGPGLIWKGISGGSGAFALFIDSAGKMRIEYRSDTENRTVIATMSALVAGSVHVLGFTWQTAVTRFYVDSAVVFTSDNSGTGGVSLKTDGTGTNISSYQGSSNFWNGDLYELVVAGPANGWTVADLAKLHTYLNQWRIY